MTTRKLPQLLGPYYKTHPAGRHVLTAGQMVSVRQSIRAIKPFTRGRGFREITKHDIFLFPLLADREGHRFTASLVASILSQQHSFLVSRYVVNKVLGGNLRRKTGASTKLVKLDDMLRRVKHFETRCQNLEELVVRIVLSGTLPKIAP